MSREGFVEFMEFVEFVGLERRPASSVMRRESKIKTKGWWVSRLVSWKHKNPETRGASVEGRDLGFRVLDLAMVGSGLSFMGSGI